MTTRTLLAVALRRWYVLLLGLALTVVATRLVMVWNPVVYSSTTTITLLQSGPNPLRANADDLVATASALVVRANGGTTVTKTSSPETTLVGEGIVDGSRVRLRDVGGQWTTSIPDPVIIVEVTGPDQTDVLAQTARLISDVDDDLAELQDQLGITENRLFTALSPEQPEIAALGAASKSRAMLGAAGIGLLLTALMLYATHKRWPLAQTTTTPIIEDQSD